MTNIKCGKCEKVYEVKEYYKLDRVKRVESDPNPMDNYGYTYVCECGYVFHKDKWGKKTKLDFKDFNLEISTVFLELEHGNGYWYETMIFPESERDIKFSCDFMERYRIKEEAIRQHKKIVKTLQNNQFKLIVKEKAIVF